MAVEKLKEVVDHELPRIRGESRLKLAQDIVRVAQLHALLAPLTETKTTPNASLTSWVESSDSRLGHALAIFELPKQGLQHHMEALFFTADREKRQLVGQHIAATILHPDKPLDACVNDLVTSFDRDELETINCIMDKRRAIQAGHIPKERAVDSLVYTAIVDSDTSIIQTLATRYPRPYIEIPPSEITLLPNSAKY